jgi:hypothetical protein
MPIAFNFEPPVAAALLSLLLTAAAPAQTPPYSVTSVPAGNQPMGMDIAAEPVNDILGARAVDSP